MQQQKRYEQALKSLESAQMQCTDDKQIETLAITLKKTIAEKDQRIARAKADENAGDFASALQVFDTYALEDDIKRVLPKFAKNREDAGDFLLAYQLYQRAGLSSDMQRLQTMKDEQTSQYQKAKTLIADGRFDDALSIYKNYKDDVQQKDTLKQKAAFLEAQEKFDDAMEIYRQAQLPDEVTRVKDFVATRKQLIANAQQQEQAAKYDKALELFQKANSKVDVQRVAKSIAEDFEKKKDYESAANYFEIAGLYDQAGRIRKAYDLSQVSLLRKLSDPEIVKHCGPACVTIVSVGDEGVGLGSGFFVANKGYILTNHHVVQGATRIGVILPSSDRVIDATVLETSDVPDLALLKAQIDENPVLKLGDSDKVETGAHVATIGSPKGLPQSFTAGNVSNSERDYEGNKCFQISVLINHGNSGGPLIDEMGQVVGITTFGEGTATVLRNGQGIGSDVQGINFAVKINEAKKLLTKKIGSH